MLKQKPYPASISLFRVNYRNSKKRCEICLKLTIKTLKRLRHCSVVFIVNFEQVSVCWVKLVKEVKEITDFSLFMKMKVLGNFQHHLWKYEVFTVSFTQKDLIFSLILRYLGRKSRVQHYSKIGLKNFKFFSR